MLPSIPTGVNRLITMRLLCSDDGRIYYMYKTNREGNIRCVINVSIRPCISLSAGPVGPQEG